MTTISQNNQIEFYKFLNRDKSIEEFENFIYSQSDLKQQIDNEIYLSLIELNFNDKYDQVKLRNIIRNQIIEERQFEEWKLKTILNDFLSQPENLDINLDKLYHLYCGSYQNSGQRKYEYRFLGNLGLNYLHWVDKGYLQTYFGENWKEEYEKCKLEFKFYHEQLKNFAIEILLAIDNKEIEILNDGKYNISDYLKNKLESENIYKLIHQN